jgi:hypothetical protein
MEGLTGSHMTSCSDYGVADVKKGRVMTKYNDLIAECHGA